MNIRDKLSSMEITLSQFILPLSDPQASLENVGGKGMSLAKLSRAGLPVPGGFHVTTQAYRRFVAENGLQPRILAALKGADLEHSESLELINRQIDMLFAAAVIPAEIRAAISAAYADHKDAAVAVRSSATAEDLPGMSFAGQMETYLNIRGEAQVLEAVKRCWASLWTARAIGYRVLRGIEFEGLNLAVVIQELVPAEAAGIMFTADALTGRSDRVTINAAWGLGEAVVGGKVTPDTYTVDKISGKVVQQQISQKDRMSVPNVKGTQEQPVPEDQRSRAVLKPSQAAGLARMGVKIEELYQQPMDIEWALEHGRFFILQARPITRLHGHNPAEGEWNDSLTGDFLWTRSNYGEAVPDVMTPCTWSFVKILLDNADPSYGPHPYGNLAGRLYKNLSEAASLAAAFGVSPKSFAGLVETGFGRLPEGVEIPIVRLSPWWVLRRALPPALRDLSHMSANLKRLPVFLREAPERCEELKRRIQTVSDPAGLVALWQADILPFFVECCRMVQASANQGGAAILTIPRNLQKLVGEDDANALLTGPGLNSGPLASLGPLLGLAQLAKGVIDRETFMRLYGHRSPHEAEISMPRPAEDPEWIDRQLADIGQLKQSATELLERQAATRQAALEWMRRRYPRKEKSLRRQIERWSAVAHEREAARTEIVRAMWVLRVFVQRAGALTGQSEDIFFLSIEEILRALAGDRGSFIHIPARRKAYQRYCALPPYPVLVRGQFDPFQWAADPAHRNDIFDAQGGNAPATALITGFPGAAGVVEGQVRVIANYEEGDQLQAGEILVTNVTNVGWTPLFPRAAAVVTDVGAPLSHAAIVARELGIPAVVGCGNATLRLKTGERVRVDGGRGSVEILESIQPFIR